MSTPSAEPPREWDRWSDARRAAAIVAIDGAAVGGAVLRAGPGPLREHWLALLARLLPRGTQLARVPLHAPDSRLLGGLDLVATLRAGSPVIERGVLARLDGGVALLAMAERLTPAAAARLTGVLDSREVILERDGLTQRLPARLAMVALDEGLSADERPPRSLCDRLALHLDLTALEATCLERPVPCGPSAAAAARRHLAAVRTSDEQLLTLAAAAAQLGIGSARATLQALRVARAAAALAGRTEVREDDLAYAVRVVLAPRAGQLPQEAAAEEPVPPPAPAEPPPQSPPPSVRGEAEEPRTSGAADQSQSLAERVLAAAQASIPRDLLARLQLAPGASRAAGPGRAAQRACAAGRGRPLATVAGDPGRGARVDVLETLRAAAPWQALRRGKARQPSRLLIRRSDIRIRRFSQRTQTTNVFVVDASGSTALHRLAEAKGAVELLLADSYVRRDRVALIAFRGRSAELLLPPTRSLLRAKRELAKLPGGGGTPLASGLDAARELAVRMVRRGESPNLIVMTDGRANVDVEGRGGRQRAEADALRAARAVRLARIAAVLIDTSPRPHESAAALAGAMGARYVPLPHANAATLALAVRSGAPA